MCALWFTFCTTCVSDTLSSFTDCTTYRSDIGPQTIGSRYRGEASLIQPFTIRSTILHTTAWKEPTGVLLSVCAGLCVCYLSVSLTQYHFVSVQFTPVCLNGAHQVSVPTDSYIHVCLLHVLAGRMHGYNCSEACACVPWFAGALELCTCHSVCPIHIDHARFATICVYHRRRLLHVCWLLAPNTRRPVRRASWHVLTTCLFFFVTRAYCLHPALCDSTYEFDAAREKKQSTRDDSTAYDPVTQWVMVHVWIYVNCEFFLYQPDREI